MVIDIFSNFKSKSNRSIAKEECHDNNYNLTII